MDFSVPFKELVNVVALGEALVFALVFLALGWRSSLATRILALFFFLFATVKIDQLYQFLGGFQSYPEYAFIFIPVQWLVTPTLYFFIRAKVDVDFKFKKVHLWTLAPAVASFIYTWFFYYQLPLEGKVALLQSGALRDPLNGLIIPLLADAIQLGYLLAAFKVLNEYGITLKNWFSRMDDQNILWVKPILGLWAVIFLVHVTMIVFVGGFGIFPFGRGVIDILNTVHLIMINALIVVGLASYFNFPRPEISTSAKGKYAASDASGADRKALYKKALKEMSANKPYLQHDLNLGQLADTLAATPRELSEAINGEGSKNFYDFVNSHRIEEALAMLKKMPERQILEVAYASGFNSKSTFNELFRKTTGKTPSQFRKSL